MPLVANLFVQSSAARYADSRNATPTTQPDDSSPSFDDVLEAARQPQQTSTPDRAATTTPRHDPSAARSEKRPRDTDATDTDSPDDAQASSDARDQSSASAQDPTKSGDTSTTDSTPAGRSQKNKDADANGSSSNPADDAAAQSAAVAQTLANPQTPGLTPAPTAGDKAALAGRVIATSDSPGSIANTQTAPGNGSKTAPLPEIAGDQSPPSGAAQKAGATKSALNSEDKADAKGSQATPIPPSASSAANANRPTSDANIGSSQSDPTAIAKPNASPLAAHSSAKAGNASHNTADSADPSQTPSSGSTTPSAQTAADDSVLASATVKTSANINAPQESSTPESNSSATPTLTASVSTPHAVDNRANSAAPAQDSPRAEPDQTFEQIVLGLRTKVDATHSKAEISLNPPNLGTLHVSVSLQNGSLTAQFQSSSDVVRELLKGNMDKLKSVLESQGVTVDKLAVGAPQDKTELSTASPGTAQTNQSANDGRSAGQYNQQPPNQKRSQDPGSFAKAWQQAGDKAPIDLVA
ncbi:MAG TPA: flagellar hook-length control protein FliK [Phycisphaerae bacterium]|nr:flagellar hook-length control protein FliK [Phycisphaerae bacterium]